MTAFAAALALATNMAYGETVWTDRLDDASRWPVVQNYDNGLDIQFGDGGLSVVGVKEAAGKPDTGWHVRSVLTKLPHRSPKFALSFRMASDVTSRTVKGGKDSLTTFVRWYDETGRVLGTDGFMPGIRKGGFEKFRLVGRMPDGAAAFEVQLGFDFPNLSKGQQVRYSDLRLVALDESAKCGETAPDTDPPRVRLVSASPTTNGFVSVRVRITDASEVSFGKTRFCVDGVDRTADFMRHGSDFALAPPSKPYTNGIHHVKVHAEDVFGNAHDHTKVFLIGEPPKGTPRSTLRDDGVTLVDGRPFFPIGIYNVRKHAFNGGSFDTALRDLKEAGFNFCHSYVSPDDPGLLAAAEKYDFKFWRNATGVTADFADRVRMNRQMLAWYIGDDTETSVSPELLRDRDENVYAADGTRISVQADYVESYRATDRYQRFADGSDVLLAEIYPVHGDDNDTNCVAEVIRDMKRIRLDNERYGANRTHAVWPIIQNFVGWKLWKRFPTPEEMYAMSFASLIHGAKGITWYTYAGARDPDPSKGVYDAGIACDATAWASATNCSRRIALLAPVFLERGGSAVDAKVVSGPAKDGYGNASVSYLVRRHAGWTYVFAVNSAKAEVRARLAIPGVSSAAGGVLWEKRSVRVKGGTLEETFAPFAVHVYRFRQSPGGGLKDGAHGAVKPLGMNKEGEAV
ncbi:MAG: hypothetical protein IKE55_07725 [Kiritimatiellae bacterium]|nr:hypothetical protein [Kiritimatiellia bacterium]